MRLKAQAKAGFYPTPPEVAEILQTWVGPKQPGAKRLLDPCCGEGEAAAQIAAAAGCEAYGVEIHTGRANYARKRLNKVVAGDIFSVRARHDAFSILFLNPPYDFDSEDGRTELSFLKHTLPYLATGGLLLFLIPQKRITERIAKVLSAYIENPEIRQFPPKQFKAFQQIIIAGTKKPRPQVNSEVFSKLKTAPSSSLPEAIPEEFHFTIPAVAKDFFIRSADITPEELAEELPLSPLWNETAIESLFNSNEAKREIKPLMPPRKAHLAMLIAAGLINNQILEADGQRLLIKGTSKKVTDRFEEKTENGIKITEKERILTEINAFDLNTGEYLQIV